MLIYCTRGTYGRDDDAFGALLQANTALARGMEVTLVLVDDGVYLCKKGQNPTKIGAVNNLTDLSDFIDLGGRLLVMQDGLDERGILKNEIVDGAQTISYSDLVDQIEKTQISLTF